MAKARKVEIGEVYVFDSVNREVSTILGRQALRVQVDKDSYIEITYVGDGAIALRSSGQGLTRLVVLPSCANCIYVKAEEL